MLLIINNDSNKSQVNDINTLRYGIGTDYKKDQNVKHDINFTSKENYWQGFGLKNKSNNY